MEEARNEVALAEVEAEDVEIGAGDEVVVGEAAAEGSLDDDVTKMSAVWEILILLLFLKAS